MMQLSIKTPKILVSSYIFILIEDKSINISKVTFIPSSVAW